MKGPARLVAAQLDPELEAALLGDFPMLQRGSADAQRFADAFGPAAGPPWWKDTTPKGPLGHAAQAVTLERRGELEAAAALYRQQAAEPGWVGLLGLLLLSWSSSEEGDRAVRDAAALIRLLRSGQRKSRLLAKAATFAFDKRAGDLGRELWTESIQSAIRGSRLERALRIEGMNLGISADDPGLLANQVTKPDPLVDLPWIYDLRLQAASGTLAEAVDERALGTWGYSIHMGTTRVGEIIAAEIQVTWIGALWLRRNVRKQLGAQLLAGGAETPDQWAYAMTMWALGGGHRPQKAFDLAEPHLDRDGADFIVRSVGESEDSTNNPQRFLDLSVAAWNLLSDETLRWAVDRVPLMVGEVPPAPESRRLWAAYALRLTAEWLSAYQPLELAARAALLDSFDPRSVGDLDPEAKEALFEAGISGATSEELDLDRVLPVLAELSPPMAEPQVRAMIEQKAGPSTIAAMLKERGQFVSEAAARKAEASLAGAVTQQSQEAKTGSQVIAGTSVRLELGRLLAHIRDPNQEAVELLVETATDPELPPDYLLEARQGLVFLRRADRLGSRVLDRLRQAPDVASEDSGFRGYTTSVLAVVRLQILATRADEAERIALIRAARDPDARVRDVAVNACAEALECFDDQALAWAVVSGLFDPVHSVAAGAAAGLKYLDRFPAAAEVAWRRLPELLARGNRRVRGWVVSAAIAAEPDSASLRSIRDTVLQQARHDRSWAVRDMLAKTD